MQGKVSEMKQDASVLEDHTFEEEMCSAFWRGVSLLKESSESSGSTVASSDPSEGFSGAPKNVSLLEPVISKLMDKDPPKGSSSEWISTAKDYAQWLQKQELRRKKEMEDLFRHLEDEIARVESLAREDEEQ